jgi:hypothetical protein
MTQENFKYSWERYTIWETPEVLQEPLSEFAENSEDLLPIWELEDEEPFVSLEEDPEMEDWLMSNV